MDVLAALRKWLDTHDPLWGLDYDGTLTPLSPDPKTVRLSPAEVERLARLAGRRECVFISGRGLDDLKARVPVPGAHFIANHGSQLLTREGVSWQWRSESWESWRRSGVEQLVCLADEREGRVEDKHFSIALHFRGARDEAWWEREGRAALEPIVGRAAVVLAGTKCWNLMPVGAPTKGITAARLCRETGHDSLIYFGDEATDETVFRVTGLSLFGVKVGPGPTAATYRLPDPDAVKALLNNFA